MNSLLSSGARLIRDHRIVAACCLGCVALTLISAFFYSVHERIGLPPDPSSSIQTQSVYWMSRIAAVGAPAAYGELAVSLAGKNPSVQHSAAHIFGGALYDSVGISGISICDARFSYGCYHEFLGEAIVEKGLAVIGELDTDCSGNPACQHGIGHGILASIGYQKSDLMKSLSLCQQLPDDQPLAGCDAGAYMEYNMETVLQGGATSTPARSPSGGDMFSPCDSVSGIEAQACYLWQPQWWWVYYNEVEHLTSQVAFEKVVQLCSRVQNADSQMACVDGAGLMAPPAGKYDPGKAAAVCDDFLNVPDALVCKGYAANVFFTTGFSQDANAVCDGLAGPALLYCSAYASGKASIEHPAALPSSL